MHLTIVKEDGVVGVDMVFKKIDLSNIQPPNFRALQWDGPTDGVGGDGEVEFSGKPKPPNEEITDLGDYYQYYLLWVDTPIAVNPGPFDNLPTP